MDKFEPRDISKIICIPLFLAAAMLGVKDSTAKNATPNLYLDVPAPVLSGWNQDNVFTVDDTADGFSGATAKTYIYKTKEDAEAAKSGATKWGDNSVAYITWELDNGSGKPPGLQVVNDNLDYKYHNCIMASGEMPHPTFPDTIVTKACNDPQGSSKRVFFQLTETETPVDLVFDLGTKDIRYKGLIDPSVEEDNGSNGGSSGGSNSGGSNKENTIDQFREEYGVGRLYRVIQKVRNDTGKRIVSYKFELGNGIGDDFQPLTFEEHGVGFEMRKAVPREFFDGRTGSAPDVDVWKNSRFATFAPKLFDDGVRPRFDVGFLDHKAAGFMKPIYAVDDNFKAQNIDSGLQINDGIIGSLSRNFFSVNAEHDMNIPHDMLGYMLPNSKVPHVIGFWRSNDVEAEPDGVVAIWDGQNWRSGRSGLDGDPATLGDNFGVIPGDQLNKWADKRLGKVIPGEDPSNIIRYETIPSDDLAGVNTDIFITIGEKLLDENNQPRFDSITLRVTARSIDDVFAGVPGSEEPLWMEGDTNNAPELYTYETQNNVINAVNDFVTTELVTPVEVSPLLNDTFNSELISANPDLDKNSVEVNIVEEPYNGVAEVIKRPSQGNEGNPVDEFVISYTPAEYFTGYDAVKYTITATSIKLGDIATSNVGTVKVLVNPDVVLGAPVVNNDNVMTAQETPVLIDVLANDDYDSDKQHMLQMRISNKPKTGEAQVSDENALMYTPATGFIGIEQFTYEVEQDGLKSNTGVVTVRVDEPLDDESNANGTVSTGSSGGGCAMGDPNSPFDPTLPLMALISSLWLIKRRGRNNS
ncbi:RTX toxin [Vibrio owensii]|uniref:choice-of-anchor F family protein n=1 Tax=Vibrio owensii TaxID=696485 RepID=UPI00039A04E7|nr:choice-of-anchor F family protein [Vibrio owensii]SUQ07810.1 RTX toxin [Vibrio owensii]